MTLHQNVFFQAQTSAAPEPGLLPAGERDHAGLHLHSDVGPVPQGEGRGRLPLHRLRLPGDFRLRNVTAVIEERGKRIIGAENKPYFHHPLLLLCS